MLYYHPNMATTPKIKVSVVNDVTLHFCPNVTVKSALLWSLPLILAVLLTPFSGFAGLFYILFLFQNVATGMVSVMMDPVEKEDSFWSDDKFYNSNLFTILSTNPLFVGLQWLKVPRV